MSSIDQTIQQINTATTIIISIMYFVNFIFRVIGLTFNVFVFTRPSLRETPCSIYFLSSTFFNFFVILAIIPLRLVLNNFNIDLATYNAQYCKIQYFAFYFIRALSCWFIAMACIDRYLHSSHNIFLRRMSSLKVAKLSVAIVSIVVPILYCHMIIFYNLIQVKKSSGIIAYSCIIQDTIYSTFITIWHLFLYSFCPSFLMLIFGCLTLRSIRMHHQIIPQNINNNRISRRTSIELLRMLSAQVLVIIISTSASSIYQLYALFTSNVTKDTLRISQENAAGKILAVLSYFAHSTSFYMFTLTGSIFRKEVFKIIEQCSLYKRNRVHITGVQTHQMSSLQYNQQTNTILKNSAGQQRYS
ncbi:unnamed protein product [Adineta steineri]|uniref:G-protein coupled receptors family 1 profile domain-containing protein n=1 Tax=Adineta steineri TaxID=433720 RepID=A0A819F9P8_9BILA|nr:unnamed protein product [Adineta steineri]